MLSTASTQIKPDTAVLRSRGLMAPAIWYCAAVGRAGRGQLGVKGGHSMGALGSLRIGLLSLR
jgi:hypothetical protein